MSQVAITLAAGVEKRQVIRGKTLLLLDLGGAASVDLVVEIAGFGVEEIRGAKTGFRLRSAEGFESVKILSTVNATVQLIASQSDISVNYVQGASVVATLDASQFPLPVANNRGMAGTPLFVTYTGAPATSGINNAPVAVAAASAAVAAANVSRTELRFLNQGPDPVAIGAPAGLTWAKRTIVLNVNDVWIESSGANLAWNAICDAAKTANVAVQEVIA